MRVWPVALIALCAAITALGQTEPPGTEVVLFARHPALSPDGDRIAFTYRGDIWIVSSAGGTARRLTTDKAAEQSPVWSPDGKQVAFSSNREGDFDVHIVAADGGEPRRLTRHSAADYATDWSPDGRTILMTSARETTRTSAVYALDVASGRSRLIRQDDISLTNPRYTPDGGTIVCIRGGSAVRMRYRGSGASDLLAIPAQGGAGAMLTRTPHNERSPMPSPDGRTLYYVSDRSGCQNLVRRAIRNGTERAQTRFRSGAIYNPCLSRDGRRIVFEREFRLWLLELKTGKAAPISLFAPIDSDGTRARRETFKGPVQEYALSPDGSRLAFVIHGEVFLQTFGASTEPLRLTETPQREQDLAWAPDGKTIIMSSDRSGEQELYRLDIETRATTRLTDAPARPVQSPVVSPNGTLVAYVRGATRSELCVVPISGGEARTLVREPSLSNPCWSPDGRMIAYTRSISHSGGTEADIFVVDIADPRPINITRYPVTNNRPCWSPDGSRVYFLSNRNRVNQIWSVALRKEAPSEADNPTPGSGEPASERNPSPRPHAAEAIGSEDQKDIHLRAQRLTGGDSAILQYAVNPADGSIVCTAAQLDQTDLWRVPAKGGKPVRLTQSGEVAADIQFTPKGEAIYYAVNRQVRTIRLGTAPVTPERITLAATVVADAREEILELFDEAWRAMRDGFYDPNMHGCDWNGVRERYRPVAATLDRKDDFLSLFTMALGELNASHCGITARAAPGAKDTASLGIALDDGYSGPGVRVGYVMPEGPAVRPVQKLRVGDIIERVNDKPLVSNEELFDALRGAAGRQIPLTVRSEDATTRVVRIRPITGAAYRTLAYDQWVQSRKDLVDSLSSGRLLYVHLNSMNASNLDKFTRAAFGDMEGRDGLVLDLRFNGGGSIADEIFAILQKRIFGWRTVREDTKPSTAPLPVFSGKVIVLANEASLSNAEVFPWGFKALKLGKVVGRRTYGGVIGTGSRTLIDGATLRMPAIGAYTLAGKNMENNGCPPDIEIIPTPEEIVSGTDRQLQRAVAELLRELGPVRARRTIHQRR